jgi:translation initiation factor IF-1
MRGEDAFRVEARVIEVLSHRTWRVELANGHRLLGFATGRMNEEIAGLKPGDKVKLQLTPFDLSTGRLLEVKKDELT